LPAAVPHVELRHNRYAVLQRLEYIVEFPFTAAREFMRLALIFHDTAYHNDLLGFVACFSVPMPITTLKTFENPICVLIF
jgi:hypothetical protein